MATRTVRARPQRVAAALQLPGSPAARAAAHAQVAGQQAAAARPLRSRVVVRAAATSTLTRSKVPLELEEGEMPLNTYNNKAPFKAKIKSVKRIVGPNATGETCDIVIETEGKIPFWEGQSYGVIPPVRAAAVLHAGRAAGGQGCTGLPTGTARSTVQALTPWRLRWRRSSSSAGEQQQRQQLDQTAVQTRQGSVAAAGVCSSAGSATSGAGRLACARASAGRTLCEQRVLCCRAAAGAAAAG